MLPGLTAPSFRPVITPAPASVSQAVLSNAVSGDKYSRNSPSAPAPAPPCTGAETAQVQGLEQEQERCYVVSCCDSDIQTIGLVAFIALRRLAGKTPGPFGPFREGALTGKEGLVILAP